MLVATTAVALLGARAAAAPLPSAPSFYAPTTPCRLIDTRTSQADPLAAGSTIDIGVGGVCGVAANATAAVLTVTVVGGPEPGFVTLFPTDSERPSTSTVNHRGGQFMANSQIVVLGGGAVSAYTLASAHVVVDVSGYFVDASSDGERQGRFVPVEPHRLVDTRAERRPTPRSSVRVATDVPSDAVAVAVNVTTTATSGPGYFAAFPAGEQVPDVSMLNVDAAGQTRAASTIVPINRDGFDVYTSRGDHVIVDITGYFTGPSAPRSNDGLFVGIDPVRLVDTREAHDPFGGPRLWDDGAREFAVDSVGEASAIAANVTVADTEDAGFVTARPAGTPPTATSTVGYHAAQQSIANLAIVPVSDRGFTVAALSSAHVVVDLSGWFTGSAAAAVDPVPVNAPPPPRRVTIIGDSSFAGIRWNGALGGLRGFEAVTSLESCRRLVRPSCRGREGYHPRTVVGEIEHLAPAGPEEILVVAVGYNDDHQRFASDFDAVVDAARRNGFHHIAWLTYRSQVGYVLPGTALHSNYSAMNTVLSTKSASGAFPDVRIWDFDQYTAGVKGWFSYDGVHETRVGSWGVADWISRHVSAFDDKPCAMPWRPGESVHEPCPDPDGLPAQIGLPEIERLYGL